MLIFIKFNFLIVCISFKILLNRIVHCDNGTNTEDIIERMFKNYDRCDGPDTVRIRVNIQGTYDISEQSSSFSIRYHFGLFWHDSRLKFAPFRKNNKTASKLTLPAQLFHQKGK